MRSTLAKAGTGMALMIAIGLVALALGTPAAGAAESQDDGWAVIFATETEGTTGQIAEALALHDWLLAHGWEDSHITLLADHLDADAAPTMENLQGAIAEVAQSSGSRSTVFIAIMDHGQESYSHFYFNAANGQVSHSQFAGWVNGIVSYKKMVVDVSFRYSGGFIQSLTGPNRVVVSSHTTIQNFMPNHFSLADGLGSESADVNGDGQVSVQEAFYYEANMIFAQYPGTQTPQIYNSAGTVILAL
jgi:hypothetical protein